MISYDVKAMLLNMDCIHANLIKEKNSAWIFEKINFQLLS